MEEEPEPGTAESVPRPHRGLDNVPRFHDPNKLDNLSSIKSTLNSPLNWLEGLWEFFFG